MLTTNITFLKELNLKYFFVFSQLTGNLAGIWQQCRSLLPEGSMQVIVRITSLKNNQVLGPGDQEHIFYCLIYSRDLK